MGLFLKALTRKKVIDRNTLTSTPLGRCLSLLDLISLGVGTVIGPGIYVLAGDVAREDTGPSIVISFLIAGIASILSALCYAEFGARMPKAGSAYVYSYVAIGELYAYVVGWNLILDYVTQTSCIARATSSYIDSLLGDRIKNFTISTIGKIRTYGISVHPDLLAVLIIFIITIVQIAGMKKTSWCMKLTAGLTLFVALFVVGVGACYAESKNWTDNFMPYGFSGVMEGAATCFYAYSGFEVIATTGEEALNPSRAIPIAIISTVGICSLAYFGVSGVLTLMWPYSALPHGEALPNVFDLKGAPWAKHVIAIGALCGLISTLLGIYVALSRMLFSMASDGLIFKYIAKVNPTTETPVIAVVVSGTFSALLALCFNLHFLLEMTSISTLMAYTTVAVCVMVLRYRPETVGFVNQDDLPEGAVGQTDHNTPIEDSPLLGVRQAQQPSERTSSLAIVAIVVSSLSFVALGVLFVWGSHHLAKAKWWAFLVLTLGSLLLVCCALLLLRLPQNKTPLRFTVPFVPVLPLFTVFINLFLILNLPYMTWIRFSVWMIIGLSIYFFYGLTNSVEGERQSHEIADEDLITNEIIFAVLQE